MFNSKFDKLFNIIMENAALTTVDNTNILNSEGYYTNFTGNIQWGATKGHVTNAKFMLKQTQIDDNQTIKDVYFYDGSFDSGVFCGYFCGGIFKGGTFKSGKWVNGIFAPDKDWRLVRCYMGRTR